MARVILARTRSRSANFAPTKQSNACRHPWRQVFYFRTEKMTMSRLDSKARAPRALHVLLAAAMASCAYAQENATLPPGVLARQGGVDVTLQDVDAFAQKIPEKERAGFFDSPTRIQNMIMSMLQSRQLATAAHAAKLDEDPIVQRRMQQVGEEVLAAVQIENFRKQLKVPQFDTLAQEYYTVHKEEFRVPGAVEVKHVLVSTKQRSDDEAKSRIGEVSAAAHAHPDQFDALVEKYSDDPSMKDNHGLIPDAASTKMVAPFAKAAAALKTPGEISPIVKTDYGYHVLKLVSRAPDKQQTFAEAKPKLVVKLRQEWIDKQVKDYTDNLRGQSLDANPELVASLRDRYVPQGTVMPTDAAEQARQEPKK
jgi:peptidyl-prolyl cis-trans isomerase C